MGQLHEVLAVEPDLKNEAQAVYTAVKEVMGLPSLLTGLIKTYRPKQEGEEKLPDEVKTLNTTVNEQLALLRKAWGDWIDVAMAKEHTNQSARADLIVDGKTLVTNVPATALLNLEGKLTQIRKIIEQVPTNDAAMRWTWDEDLGCYVAGPERKLRTKKVPRSHVLYEATPEHPAQVEMYHEDVVVGEWETTFWSGMWSPTRKREVLDRINELIIATRQARQRANTEEVKPLDLAGVIFDHITGAPS